MIDEYIQIGIRNFFLYEKLCFEWETQEEDFG